MATPLFIKIKVTSSAKKNEVIQINSDTYRITVKEKAENGRANKAVQQLLASFFSVLPHKIKLIKGGKQPNKIFEVIKG